jgi:hypothetical protein
MRKTLWISLIAGFAGAAMAQEQPKPPVQLDEDTLYRQRLEGAAGGTREIKPQEKAGADAGAGTNREFRPGGESQREHNEGSSQRDAGRGASAGQELESRDARPGSPRP